MEHAPHSLLPFQLQAGNDNLIYAHLFIELQIFMLLMLLFKVSNWLNEVFAMCIFKFVMRIYHRKDFAAVNLT